MRKTLSAFALATIAVLTMPVAAQAATEPGTAGTCPAEPYDANNQPYSELTPADTTYGQRAAQRADDNDNGWACVHQIQRKNGGIRNVFFDDTLPPAP